MNAPLQDPQASAGSADSFYRRAFILAAAALIGLAVYQVVKPFLQPMAWAAILALLLHPLQLRLSRLLRGREGLAALILTLLVLLMFIGPLTGLAVAFAAQAGDLAELIPGLMDKVGAYDSESFASLSWLQGLFDLLNRTLSISAGEVQQWALGGVRRMLERLASMGGMAALGAVGTVLAFTVMFFLLFFLLRDGVEMARTAINLVPLEPARKALLVSRLNAVTRAVVAGTVLTALVQGTLLGIGFAMAGLPAPVVFGVVGAVLSVVPFGGTALVWVPGCIALFLMGETGWGLFLAAWGVVLVSSADNFLKPLLIGGKADVPTLAVFIGVLGGLSAFGLIGMFLGPVLIALVLTLVKFASE